MYNITIIILLFYVLIHHDDKCVDSVSFTLGCCHLEAKFRSVIKSCKVILFVYVLQGLDDMESDLFGGSLGKKSTPSKSPKPVKSASEKKKTGTDSKLPSTSSSAADSTKSKMASVSSSSSAKSMSFPCDVKFYFHTDLDSYPSNSVK